MERIRNALWSAFRTVFEAYERALFPPQNGLLRGRVHNDVNENENENENEAVVERVSDVVNDNGPQNENEAVVERVSDVVNDNAPQNENEAVVEIVSDVVNDPVPAGGVDSPASGIPSVPAPAAGSPAPDADVGRLVSAIELLMEIQEDTVDDEESLMDTIAILTTMAGLGWRARLRARLRATMRVWRNHILFVVGVASSTAWPIFLSPTDRGAIFCGLGFVIYVGCFWYRVRIRSLIRGARDLCWLLPALLDCVMGFTSAFIMIFITKGANMNTNTIVGYVLFAAASTCAVLTILPDSDYGWLMLFSFVPSQLAKHLHTRLSVSYATTILIPFICMFCQAYSAHRFRDRQGIQ